MTRSSISKAQEFSTLRYEIAADHVARITLSRPDTHNAQNVRMTYELNAAFDMGNRDEDVKVIVMAADGPHFSSGHDLKDDSGRPGSDYPVVNTWGGFGKPGAEGIMAREQEIYFQMCLRWRNISKPTIAQVQGKCITGGLMLIWVCDLIVASEDASFQDTAVSLGGGGVEYFAHPWELGHRKAKEMLFTGEALSAHQAERAGMVNRVVSNDRLAEETLNLARQIARQPSFALKMAKESVNQALEAQGQSVALRAAFGLHQLTHMHNLRVFDSAIDPTGFKASGLKKQNDKSTDSK